MKGVEEKKVLAKRKLVEVAFKIPKISVVVSRSKEMIIADLVIVRRHQYKDSKRTVHSQCFNGNYCDAVISIETL